MPIEAHTDLSSLMTAPETMENEGQVLKTILEEKVLKKSMFHCCMSLDSSHLNTFDQ